MRHLTRTGTGLVVAICAAWGLAACGDDTGDQAQTDATATATASKSPRDQSSAPAAPKPEEETRSVGISVQGDTLTPQAKQVELPAGEPLKLQVTSDRAGELHVHSAPEQTLNFGKGKSTLTLTIDRPGQVDVEEHESGELLLRLLVR